MKSVDGSVNVEGPKGQQWTRPSHFFLGTLGLTMSLTNLWKFPSLFFKYGGGSFMLAYCITFCLVGYPLFFMELSLGQFHSRGPGQIIGNLVPAFQGLGYAKMLVVFNSAIYFNGILAWALFYMSTAFTPHWETCRNSTALHHQPCFSVMDRKRCVGESVDTRWFVKGMCYDKSNISLLIDHLSACITDPYDRTAAQIDGNRVPLRSACSFALTFNFEKAGDAKRILFGEQSTLNSSYSVCWGKKTGECVLEKDETEGCGRFKEDRGSMSHMIGHRVFDMRHRTNEEALKLRGKSFRAIRYHSYHHNLTLILKAYCGAGELIPCLKKMMDPDESFTSAEFYHRSVDNFDGFFLNKAGFRWPLPTALGLVWAIVGFAICGGPHWVGKIFKITAGIPLGVMFALTIFAITLPGGIEGISAYFETRICELADPYLWMTAAGQVLISLGIGCGGLEFLSSFNTFKYDLHRNSVLLAIGNSVLSFVAGFAIFGVLGHMARALGPSTKALLQGSTHGIAFSTFSQALSGSKDGGLLVFLFYLMLASLALHAEIIFFGAFMRFILHELPGLKKWKVVVMPFFCLFFVMLGVSNLSVAGDGWMGLIKGVTFDWLASFCVIGEIIAVAYVYGFRNLFDDISMMVGREKKQWKGLGLGHVGNMWWNSPLKHYFTFTLLVTAPLGVLLLTSSTIILGYVIPPASGVLGTRMIFFLLGGLPFLFMIIGGCILASCAPYPKGKGAWKAVSNAGPILNVNREGRYTKLQGLESMGTNTDQQDESEKIPETTFVKTKSDGGSFKPDSV